MAVIVPAIVTHLLVGLVAIPRMSVMPVVVVVFVATMVVMPAPVFMPMLVIMAAMALVPVLPVNPVTALTPPIVPVFAMMAVAPIPIAPMMIVVAAVLLPMWPVLFAIPTGKELIRGSWQPAIRKPIARRIADRSITVVEEMPEGDVCFRPVLLLHGLAFTLTLITA